MVKVDITTKSLPDEFYMNIGVSGTYNTQLSLINNFLTDAAAGQWDWLGYDDGTRSKPEVLDQYADQICFNVARSTANAGRVPANEQQRNVINKTSRSLDNPFVAGTEKAPINHSLDFSMGNTLQFLGKNLGYNVGINYDKEYTYYSDGVNGFHTQVNANEMVTEQNFSTENGVKNTQLGGLVSLAYQFSPNHEITLTNLYNHVNATTARVANGYWRNTSRPFYEDRYINFEERELNNTQLQGEHFFESLHRAKLEWTLGYVTSTQDNPDLRQWGYTNIDANNSGTYLLQQSEVGFLPSHFYRYLTDKQYTAKLDIAIPFSQDKENEIKLGFNYSMLDREFDEFIYSYVQVAKTQFNPDYVNFAQAAGDFQQFFSLDNTGFINTPETNGTGRGYGYGNYYSDQTNNENAYTGSSEVTATYLMAAYKLLPKLKLIGGAILEITDLSAASKASTSRGGNINEVDILPALNVIYNITENSNLRAAVSQTLARPNIREIAPFAALGGIAFPIYLGNENLKRTLIQNYDLRYEIYPNAGQLFAVSAYYKNFNDPIVWQLTPSASTPEIKPINVDEATVYGAEVEFRKSLDFIAPALHNLRLSTNVSYIFSRVNKSPEELAALRNADRPNIEDTRPFQGQSPYIVNFSLFHMSDKLAWENTVSFNVFGDRLSFVTGALDPDVYEQSRPSLNFISKKRIGDNVSIGLSATNLLNMEYLSSGICGFC